MRWYTYYLISKSQQSEVEPQPFIVYAQSEKAAFKTWREHYKTNEDPILLKRENW